MTNGREQGSGDRQMAESQLSELQNMRVLLEEARGLSRNLAYHRRARLEARIWPVLPASLQAGTLPEWRTSSFFPSANARGEKRSAVSEMAFPQSKGSCPTAS